LSLPKSFAFPGRRFFVAERRRINPYTDLKPDINAPPI
jgi:hypothetical protein